MSTSLLYHAFGIIGYFYQRTLYKAGAIIVAIKEDHWRLRCRVCRGRQVKGRGKQVRRFRAVPIGRKAVYIEPAPRHSPSAPGASSAALNPYEVGVCQAQKICGEKF